ncbi:hypothetical protein [Actinacidiphila acididurans]|uniref:Uncharacterized protein n=1 Tax=Actinacidiphila acididurans TaxID=2784346 RepID=A0ABS2U3R9_9ACTN|nr:hypothetical protein [Actinacidiphila acididurans]MBM9509982.1 hypothetical protein [Actinacidiphila acididurans]
MTVPPEPEGHDSRHCGARKRQGEGTCTRPAGWGTDHAGHGHCKLHGGSTTDQGKAARAAKAEAQARTALATLDVQPVDNPLVALRLLAGQAVAWQEALAACVNRLGDRFRYEGLAGGEQLRSEIALYERAMDRCGQILGLIAKLNIDERLAAISEQQADVVIAAIDAALAHAGINGPAAAEAKRVAAHRLRSV